MYIVIFMHVADRQDNLGSKKQNSFLIERRLFLQQLIKLTTFHILKYEEYLTLTFKNIIEVYQERMIKVQKNFHFLVNEKLNSVQSVLI